MALSSGLTLTDLSDYLAPSQACIKPVTYIPAAPSPAAAASAELIIGEDLHLYEQGPAGDRGKKLKKAEITLNDCLACSGCITSAESVLVSLQSHEELYRVLREQPELVPILSVAPQSVASLAALYDFSLAATMRGLRRFFKQRFGFRLVFDTTFPRALSLAETRRELLERRAHAHALSSSSPSSSSSSLASILNASTASLSAPTKLSPSTSSIAPLPVLSSACPGWICYAEKTHGDLLPFVSGVKSPQAVSGLLVKGRVVAGRLGLRPDQIFHVAVMPCYDKKLEASRPDFATTHVASSSAAAEPISVRDVDLVLTTGEVARMLEEEGVSLVDLAEALPPPPSEAGATGTEAEVEGETERAYFPFSDLLAPPRGTSSGSYVATAISALLDSAPAPSAAPPYTSTPPSSQPTPLTRADWPYLRLDAKLVRSEDYIEYSLVRLPHPYSSGSGEEAAAAAAEGVVLARAAKCYGFRNLQNVVRKLSREAGISLGRGAAGRAPAGRRRGGPVPGSALGAAAGTGFGQGPEVEFIEVMACPGGCVNGGGQVPPPKDSAAARRQRQRPRRVGATGGGEAAGGGEHVLDEEGMPDLQAEGIEAELKLVADPAHPNGSTAVVVGGDGGQAAGVLHHQDRVLSAKEWVAEVERRYWSETDGDDSCASSHSARPEADNGIDLAALHPSIRPYVASLPSPTEQQALRRVLDELLEFDGTHNPDADADQRRRELLRTSYRAVQTEEVNGLAVVW